MRRVAALLAAVLAAGALGCGGGGAEPGAPKGATLILDFQPNAVHAGIYSALRRGLYRGAGIDLNVQAPGASTDAPRLLAAGRAQFAILDIHDLGLAAQRGLDVVGLMPIVQRPLAAVLARADGPVSRPRDLQGRRAGVTGLPSDDAVLDSEVSADGGQPARVRRVTIGFNAVADLAARKVDGATGFWNAEAVALRQRGIGVRVFRVDRFGAPAYPELVLCTSHRIATKDPALVSSLVRATIRGYRFTLAQPGESVSDLMAEVPGLQRSTEQAELAVLLPVLRDPGRFRQRSLRAWGAWDVAHGLLSRRPAIGALFEPPGSR